MLVTLCLKDMCVMDILFLHVPYSYTVTYLYLKIFRTWARRTSVVKEKKKEGSVQAVNSQPVFPVHSKHNQTRVLNYVTFLSFCVESK